MNISSQCFVNGFISLILNMKSKFHSFELSCARGLMGCIFKRVSITVFLWGMHDFSYKE